MIKQQQQHTSTLLTDKRAIRKHFKASEHNISRELKSHPCSIDLIFSRFLGTCPILISCTSAAAAFNV